MHILGNILPFSGFACWFCSTKNIRLEPAQGRFMVFFLMGHGSGKNTSVLWLMRHFTIPWTKVAKVPRDYLLATLDWFILISSVETASQELLLMPNPSVYVFFYTVACFSRSFASFWADCVISFCICLFFRCFLLLHTSLLYVFLLQLLIIVVSGTRMRIRSHGPENIWNIPYCYEYICLVQHMWFDLLHFEKAEYMPFQQLKERRFLQ